MKQRTAIVIVNYRTPDMTAACLDALVPEVDSQQDRVFVVDNASGDDSIPRLRDLVSSRGWDDVVQLIASPRNGGFAAGNNTGLAATDASFVVLLNSDTLVGVGSMDVLRRFLELHDDVGMVGPRLTWRDGVPQESAFYVRSPKTEFLRAANTGVVTRMLGGREVAMPLADASHDAEWISFACVMIRREVFEQIGLLDEGYFMYFEDVDFCRRARDAGWRIMHLPEAQVVHLRGGSSSVKAQSAARKRLPRYYYESRSRYFAKFYGKIGLWATNLLWFAGWCIGLARRVVSAKHATTCSHEWVDNWTNATNPLRESGHGEEATNATA